MVAPVDPNTMEEQELYGDSRAHAAHQKVLSKDGSRGRKDGSGDRKSELAELKSDHPGLAQDP